MTTPATLPPDWTLPGVPFEALEHAALVIVDAQRDFFTGGSLAVKDSEGVVPILNAWVYAFRASGRPIAAPVECHPPLTSHFQQHGGPWPVHCVAGTEGALLHPDLDLPDYDNDALTELAEGGYFSFFPKAFNSRDDGYSGFDGKTVLAQMGEVSLAEWLMMQEARILYIGGIATDYCVRMTVLDAIQRGFHPIVILDAIAAVNNKKGDNERAIAEMHAAGALFLALVDGEYQPWTPEVSAEEDPDTAIPEMAIQPADDVTPEESEGLPDDGEAQSVPHRAPGSGAGVPNQPTGG